MPTAAAPRRADHALKPLTAKRSRRLNANTRPRPVTSIGERRASVSGPGITFQPAAKATSPRGRFTKKIHSHDATVRSNAAIPGPATPITPHTVELAAKARPIRCAG